MSSIIFTANITSLLSNLPNEPGVYQMIDASGAVLYVGKAANLKKRVGSYFNKQNTGKTKALISHITCVEVSVTRSETEALLLESSLIKTLLPKYNVLLRDDKSYPYIHISTNQSYPRIELYRSKKKPHKTNFFGPYPSVAAVRETLSIIQKVFKIRNCRDSYFNARSRPCLQYQIKRCSAPCTDYISVQEYQQAVADATRFLQGKSQLILDELTQRMEQAVGNLAFEEAAVLRDQIKSLRLIQERQGVAQLRGDADVIAIEAQPGFAAIQCVSVRDGQVIANQTFFPSMPEQSFSTEEDPTSPLWQQVFEAFISFYYGTSPERVPALLITHQLLDNITPLEAMLSELRGKRCRIQTKPRGIKARWLDFAINNLHLAVSDYFTSSATMQKRYDALALLLQRQMPILRMECFDVSHTQGDLTVASCVVFDTAGPRKKDYRRFNIRNITPGDDYAAMKQVITRRFKRLLTEQYLPDILIVDGGKGQTAVAQSILQELGINEVTLIGIAKGRDRKAGWERLILVKDQQEISLPADSPALHLLQHIRDEAHRFAITTHRKKRQRAQLTSSLETIEGVGPKKRKALLSRFGGLRELSRASLEEIAKVNGINEVLAGRIFQHFHS